MHLRIPCMQCFQAAGEPDVVLYRLEVHNDGPYSLTCRNGHTTATILQEQKFEVLSGLAANAIIDGYYREAVASFTSALECFYEFYIKVVCSHGEVRAEELNAAWNLISRQSERQLGAFVFLHLITSGKRPALLPSRFVELRNDVVHRGRIPTRTQSIDFGQAVIDVVAPALGELKKAFHKEINEMILRHISTAHRLVEKNVRVSSMSFPMPLNISRAEAQQTLLESISKLISFRTVAAT